MFEAYLLTTIGVALAQASPGPNFLAVVSAGMGNGRKAALMTVLGVATGMLVWATAVAFGLATIIKLYPVLLTGMKIIGGAYLLYMAWKAVSAAMAGKSVQVKAAGRASGAMQAWRRGLLVIVTNPKAALMWMAVGSFLFGSGLEAWQVALYGPVAAVSAILIYGSYGLLFTTEVAVRAYGRFSRWIEYSFGAAFGFLGGKLFFDGVKELRT